MNEERTRVRHPLIFVHGAWHGAWAWELFEGYFRGEGYECRVFDFRGHGARVGEGLSPFTSTERYVEDLEKVAAEYEEPILIGHSMGGLVIQKYLTRRRARAAVLIAAVPFNGVPLSTIMHLMVKVPFKIVQLSLFQRVAIDRMDLVRDLFYQAGTAENIVRDTYEKVVPESPAALWRLSLAGKCYPATADILPGTPLCIVHGGRDFFVTPACQEKMARRYGADRKFYPEEAHNLMCDGRWRTVAQDMDGWIRSVVETR